MQPARIYSGFASSPRLRNFQDFLEKCPQKNIFSWFFPSYQRVALGSVVFQQNAFGAPEKK